MYDPIPCNNDSPVNLGNPTWCVLVGVACRVCIGGEREGVYEWDGFLGVLHHGVEAWYTTVAS